MKKILLTESFAFTPQKMFLTESSAGEKRLVASGQFGKADIPTANGRIYKRALWERELAKLMPKDKESQCFGELDHPQDGQTKLQRVSHLITDIKLRDDGTIEGTFTVLEETRNGKQLIAILNGGGKVGVSSRGFGSVTQNEDGLDVVADDFQLLTWDVVADPAAAGSYPEFEYKESSQKTESGEVNMNKLNSLS